MYLISQKGTFFSLNSDDIYFADNCNLGYLNEKTYLKNDIFIKILPNNQYLDIETNKNKSVRLNFNELNLQSNKKTLNVNFLKLEHDEYFENCYSLEKFID